MWIKSLVRMSNVVLIFSLMACGGGESSGDDEQDQQQDVPPLTYDESEELIDKITQDFQVNLTSGDIDDAYRQLAADLESDPSVVAVKLVDTEDQVQVYAKLDNGAILTFPYIEIPEPPPGYDIKAKLKQKPSAPLQKISPQANFDLPFTKKAIFLELQGLPTNASELADMADENGYEVSRNQHAGVEFFKTLGNYSIVHVNTHGDAIEWENVWYTALGTDDKRNTEQDLAFEENGDFEAIRVVLGRGVYVIGKDDPYVSEDTYYFVTDRFFATYVNNFPNYSLFYADACYSAYYPYSLKDSGVLQPLARELINNKNVAAYLGWTKRVSNPAAIRASDYLYTRMLANNERFEPKNPPLVPWGLTESYDGLQTAGYERDDFSSRRKYRQAELQMIPKNYQSPDQYDVRLLPTISGLSVVVDIDEETTKLEVMGDFGPNKGKVWKCDQDKSAQASSCNELTVDTWDEFEIVADISGCNDCNGYIMATVDDRESNYHPLSKWKGDLTVTGQATSIGPNINGTVKFEGLGEIVDERAHPESEPQISFSQTAVDFGLNTKFEYQFSGNFEDPVFFYEYPVGQNKGEIMVSAGGKTAFAGAIAVNPEELVAKFQSTIIVEATVKKTTKDLPPVTTTEKMPVVIPLVFDADITRYGTIQGGNENIGLIKVEWNQITPENAPDEKTSR